MGEAGPDEGLAPGHRRVGITAGGRIADAPEYFIDGIGGHPDAFDDFLHGNRAEFIVINVLHGAAEFPEGGAHCADDDDIIWICHLAFFLSLFMFVCLVKTAHPELVEGSS